jgi:putative FmdB family regulatory protein
VPTYQYACKDCGHAFEQFQSFNDDALSVCPQCEGRLRKVFNAVGVVFKGSGFYRNDSRPAASSTDTPSTTSASNGSSGTATSSDTGGSNGTSPSTASKSPSTSKPSDSTSAA